MKQLVMMAILLSLGSQAWAQKNRFKVYKRNSTERAVIKNSRPLAVYYEKVSWNENPTAIESGYMYLRDNQSGELTELLLHETKPDSGVFSTQFPIGALKQARIATEIYSAPPSMLVKGNRLELMKTFIEDGSIKRKPFLLRVLRNKGQVIDIFDTKGQALTAYEEFKTQLGLAADGTESQSIIEIANQKGAIKTKAVDSSTLQSLFMANESGQQATNEKNAELREVLLNIEKKRRAKVKAEEKVWPASLEKANEKKAVDTVKSAVTKLTAGELEGSMNEFLEASNLNPSEEDFYQQYGVSLFRNKNFNQAIVVLQNSSPSKNRLAEKDFYIAMSFFQLKDYPNAVEYFDKVIQSGNASFGPTSAFYKGSALIELQEFDKAKEAFQYVLDNSKDPKLDQQAEKYIEYSLDRKALAEKQSNWFFLDGVLGLIYDSNIILADDQLLGRGDITNENGWRFLAQVTPKFRPYYSEKNEINIALNLTTMKSFTDGFATNARAETADPLLLGLSVPWTHRTTIGGKGYFFDLAPGYDSIIMDLDGTGAATITNSTKLDFRNTWIINKNWIAKGDLSLSSNDANILGDETSADAFGTALRLSSIFILNKDLERYLIPDIGYRINAAEASTFAFNRIDFGLTYTSSIFDSFMWNNRIAYFLANYESNRTDNNYTLSSGVSKRINSHWNWGLMATYTINNSTTNQYDKYNFVSTFSFSY